MAAGFVQGLNREKSPIRIRLVLTEGSEESAKKLDEGQADLAILRPDIALPAQGDTALITRRSFPFIITTKETAIGRIADLRGKRIGVARNPAGNLDAASEGAGTVRGRRPRRSRSSASRQDEIVPYARGKRIDAFFSIKAVGARTNNDGVNRLRSAFGEDPMLIPIREADAIKARHRSIETGEIVRGALGGDPPRPSENLSTISVTSRLMASQSLDDDRRRTAGQGGAGAAPDAGGGTAGDPGAGDAGDRQGRAALGAFGRGRLHRRRAGDLLRALWRLVLSRRDGTLPARDGRRDGCSAAPAPHGAGSPWRGSTTCWLCCRRSGPAPTRSSWRGSSTRPTRS